MTPTAQQIIAAVAEVSGLEIHQVKAGTKTVSHVQARWAAMLLIVDLTSLSYGQAARELRLINHTTITHGIRQCKKLLSECQTYANLVLDARRMALEIAAGRPLTPKKEVEAPHGAPPLKIPPCLNVVGFRPKRQRPRPWLRADTVEDWNDAWYAENEARFNAAMSIAHPELIDWDFQMLRQA